MASVGQSVNSIAANNNKMASVGRSVGWSVGRSINIFGVGRPIKIFGGGQSANKNIWRRSVNRPEMKGNKMAANSPATNAN